MKRAAVYCRVSTSWQSQKGFSMSYQMEMLPIIARKKGYLVAQEDIFCEVSSGANDERPEYSRMLAKVIEGRYQAIFVAERSRLSRTDNRKEEQRIIKALQECGCKVVTPTAIYDPSSIDGEFIWDILSAIDRNERKRLHIRNARSKYIKASKGGYYGGGIPTGYVKKWDEITGKVYYEIDEIKMKPVRLAFKWVLRGMLVFQIAQKLNQMGYATKGNTKLLHQSVKRWLRNPNYAGYTHIRSKMYLHKLEKFLFTENHFLQPIVSKANFAKVQVLLDSRRAMLRSTREPSQRHPLTGILICPSCKNKMRVNSKYRVRKQNTYRWYYQCNLKHVRTESFRQQPQSIPYTLIHQLALKIIPKLEEFGYPVNLQKINELYQGIKNGHQTASTHESLFKPMKELFSLYFKRLEFSRDGYCFNNFQYKISTFITQRDEIFILNSLNEIEKIFSL